MLTQLWGLMKILGITKFNEMHPFETTNVFTECYCKPSFFYIPKTNPRVYTKQENDTGRNCYTTSEISHAGILNLQNSVIGSFVCDKLNYVT